MYHVYSSDYVLPCTTLNTDKNNNSKMYLDKWFVSFTQASESEI